MLYEKKKKIYSIVIAIFCIISAALNAFLWNIIFMVICFICGIIYIALIGVWDQREKQAESIIDDTKEDN